MLYSFIKRSLFTLDPETAHHVTLNLLRGGEKSLLLKLFPKQKSTIPVKCMGLEFPNPVASGRAR